MYVLCGSPLSCGLAAGCELELELILSQMAQRPVLRGEVGARALRVRSDVRGHGQVRLCKAHLAAPGPAQRMCGSLGHLNGQLSRL